MKASVLYFSKSGTTKQMAEAIVQGMSSVDDIEAKAFSIEEIDDDWVKESSCIIIGSPTYYADVAGAVKVFLEKIGKYGLAGKLGGAFATADYVHGGANIAIQTILTHMMVYGMVVYSGGGSCGLPVIHQGPVALKGDADTYTETFTAYGQRMATKAKDLF